MLDVDIKHVEAGGFGDLRDLDAAHQAHRHRGHDLVARQLLLHRVTNDFFCLHNSLAWFFNAIAVRVASMAEDGTKFKRANANSPFPDTPEWKPQKDRSSWRSPSCRYFCCFRSRGAFRRRSVASLSADMSPTLLMQRGAHKPRKLVY